MKLSSEKLNRLLKFGQNQKSYDTGIPVIITNDDKQQTSKINL